MALDLDVRSAVATLKTVTASLQVSVSHAPWIGHGQEGTGQWGAAVEHPAIVDTNYRQHKLPTGEVVSCAAQIIILEPIDPNGATGRREPIDPRDIFTMPDGQSGPVVDTPSGVLDPTTNRPFFAIVVLG